MRRVLIKYAATSSAAVVSLLFIVALLLFGMHEAMGVVIGGAIAALDFIGIIYLTSKLLEPSIEPKRKAGAVFLLLGKLAFVAVLLWWVISKAQVSALGTVAGIGAAILGFTWGLSRASASPEGQKAIEAEEQRIRDEMERKGP